MRWLLHFRLLSFCILLSLSPLLPRRPLLSAERHSWHFLWWIIRQFRCSRPEVCENPCAFEGRMPVPTLPFGMSVGFDLTTSRRELVGLPLQLVKVCFLCWYIFSRGKHSDIYKAWVNVQSYRTDLDQKHIIKSLMIYTEFTQYAVLEPYMLFIGKSHCM